jgi:cytochrome P450
MADVKTVLLPKYDALDPAVMADPYPTYMKLRQTGPLCRGGAGQWVVTRHADVATLLHDSRLAHEFPEEFRLFSMGEGPAASFFRRIILNRDPPEHTRLRRLMSAAFSPSLVRILGDHIGSMVDELLMPLLDRDGFDAVQDIAFPLPAMVICDLIGVPAGDRNQVRPYATDLAKAFGTQIPEKDRAAVNGAIVWLRDYIGALLEDRRKSSRDDLLSSMLNATEKGDRLDYEEIVDNAVFLFFAGFETTMNLIGTGCAALMDYPDQLSRLRQNYSLIPTAVEEFLRYDAPIQSAGRLLLTPVEIGGRSIRKGRVLILLLGSANHDERRFHEPERLDVGREPNPHVSFGGGIHHCLGATLARLEVSVLLRRLLDKFTMLEPSGKAIRRISSGFRSLASVPIRTRSA